MAFGQQSSRDTGMVDKLVTIKRVAKTVKGGRRMSLAAIIVVGDEAGRVGWGSGKAKETPDAIRKATDIAKRAMMRVPMRAGRTIHHEVEGRFGASKVMLRPAKPGTGIIAGGPMRAIFEAMGIKDVVAKSMGSNNPYNMIQATFDAFTKLETPRSIAAKRGIKVTDLTLHKAQFTDEDQVAPVAAPAKKAAPKKEAAKKSDDSKPAKKASAKKAEPAVKSESKKDSLKKSAAAKPAAKTEAAAPKAEAKVEEK